MVRVRRAVVVLRCVLAAGLEPAVVRVERVVDALRVEVVPALRVAGLLVVVVVLLVVVAIWTISPSRVD